MNDFNERTNPSDKEKDWLEKNAPLLNKLFENVKIRDFVFEPFKGVFEQPQHNIENRIPSTITQVAIANAVIAGLPGKLGIGVAVSMCLEAWMAYTIAKSVGLKIHKINDIWKYFGLIAGVFGTIFWGFRHILGFAFTFINIVGALPATVLAELLVTDIVGVLFWFGFTEAKENGSFKIHGRMLGEIKDNIKCLFKHQKNFAKSLCNINNIKLVGSRIKTWLTGDIVNEIEAVGPAMRGEIFSFAAMAYLIDGRTNELEGPLGKTFIDSIRRAYSDKLGEATIEEMGNFFSGRTPTQLSGDVNLVKGEMFEHLVESSENMDGDVWTAKLHELRNVPGSDIVFTNMETGQQVEVSLKSTDLPHYIENALHEYPDIPILTTEEMEQYFDDHPMIDYVDISDNQLEKITNENFDRMANNLEPINTVGIAISGVVAKTVSSLWPFVIAFLRKKITSEQLKQALTKVLGKSGISLTSRIGFAFALGPIFAWYLLARCVILAVKGGESLS